MSSTDDFGNNNNSNNSNNNHKQFELTPELQQTGIVDGFFYNIFNNELVLNLNHVYKVTFNRRDWTNTTKKFLKALKDKGVSDTHSNQLRDVLDNNHDLILNEIWSAKQQGVEIEGDSRSSTEKAFDFAEEQIQKLFTDQFGVAHAVIEDKEHLETLPIKSSRFKNWLYMKYYEESGNTDILSSEAVTNAINLLAARGEFNDKSIKLDIRVAADPQDPFTIYYDLTNENWEVVKLLLMVGRF